MWSGFEAESTYFVKHSEENKVNLYK